MTRRPLFILVCLAVGQFPVAAEAQTTKEIQARYAADKKLCAEETSSSARMQCLRDAKAEYDKALAAAKSQQPAAAKTAGNATCPDCGKVVSVNVVEKKGEGGAIGVIGGGVAGALVGHQVGKGTGKDLATIAGAAGGAYAGHKIEEKVRTKNVWVVRVRLDSGEERSVELEQDPGLAAGTPVRVNGNQVVRR